MNDPCYIINRKIKYLVLYLKIKVLIYDSVVSTIIVFNEWKNSVLVMTKFTSTKPPKLDVLMVYVR